VLAVHSNCLTVTALKFCSFHFSLAAFGEVFANIGCREPQPQASEVFTTFGEAHRSIERYAIKMLKTVKPVCQPGFYRDLRRENK